MKTRSEEAFEQFCLQGAIPCQRIKADGCKKTPDFEITLADLRVIVEIKELSANEIEDSVPIPSV